MIIFVYVTLHLHLLIATKGCPSIRIIEPMNLNYLGVRIHRLKELQLHSYDSCLAVLGILNLTFFSCHQITQVRFNVICKSSRILTPQNWTHD